MSLLARLRSPTDLKALTPSQLPVLAEEIRQRLIEVTSKTGGHIGPNLGVVELSIALHRVFSTPRDSIVWDVSHQGYVHKLLTGRNNAQFEKIRQTDGLSGFLNRAESPHDAFGAGHAGTGFSAAVGMAAARDLRGENFHVVSVIGDAALTCGVTLEALNNVKGHAQRIVVVLNDNEWSIDKNVGALATYLNELITTPTYNRIHGDLEAFLEKVPGGETIRRLGSKAKQETKDFLVPSSLFEKFGMRYIGPIDGHDLPQLLQYLEFARDAKEPVLLHVITQKGRGLPAAISQPEKFHGLGSFDAATGKTIAPATPPPPAYQDVFGAALLRFAKADKNIVGITGAMPSGTGLNALRDQLPRQYFDVGIAEEHAVVFAAGLATRGVKPVVAIYSTFLQRAFDPVLHDVCLQNLPVVFAMDRAGLSPNDGPTHHGLFDIGYLRIIPGAVLMQPKDEDELVDMLWTGLQSGQAAFVRYPRGSGLGVKVKDTPAALPIGKAEVLREGSDIFLWALGPWIQDAHKLADRLRKEEGVNAAVVNPRFIKPLDRELLLKHASLGPIFTFEDHVLPGGFGSAVLETLAEAGVSTTVTRIGWPDQFVEHGSSVNILREANGLGAEAVYQKVKNSLRPSGVSAS